MGVPQLDALDAVESALRAMVADGSLTIPDLRVIKTLRPQRVLEQLHDDTYAIVYPRSQNRRKTSAQWEEYQIEIAVELIRQSRSLNPLDHEEERQMVTYADTIATEMAQRTSVSSQMMQVNAPGQMELGAAEEMDLVSVTVSFTYRIMKDVA